ncbi:MAG TPA: Rne/Rng family ribonuclease [Smithellaceae bacterium]|nr:Rne/Rng family ribonuclease [Smithellaceae bacterium]HOS08483.1 Rne/Rng family ribonuclease [Smithellaceae bacterium]HOU05671.1 Rne/Rng family ribonuclease [Smithellaceae bacterium]HPD49094.1 Rne/Rng family ribonuclease [Smithellaceae bacterium]HPL49402.1 Rne/Rng family ribonuclease [Smithellaceae bacterium]
MKHTMLVNAVHKEQMRMATVNEKGKLIEFNIQMSVREPITGNIYKGKVLKVERGLQAAFVDYGGGKDGFLPLKDTSAEYFTPPGSGQEDGTATLKPGQEIIVQVLREASGNKGALLTSYISLPGRYLVLLPNRPGIGISRKIESEEDREKIKNLVKQIKLPAGMGFIVRTAGINRTKQEIQRDYQLQMRLWKEIHKKALNSKAPLLIYQETDFGVRSLRDYLTPDIGEILVDDLDTFRKMRAYLKAVTPRQVKILKHYKDKAPIFEKFQLEEQIRVIYQERVELKSGGYIIINPTEAMITIDVNSGRGSSKRNIEETAFKTNIEACEEIARQLRLRDLGGLIVIDFIDMMDKKHINEVEKAFKKALSIDRARIQLARISKFGLLELSRQKKKSTIQEISYIKCPYCAGSGLRPSLEYAALRAFRKIESEAVKGMYSDLKVVLPHEIASYILNNKRSKLMTLESTCGLTLHISGSTEMAWDSLDIKKTIKETSGENMGEFAHEHETAEIINFSGDDRKDTGKRKSRRRPRHKKKKTLETKSEEKSLFDFSGVAGEAFPVLVPPSGSVLPVDVTSGEGAKPENESDEMRTSADTDGTDNNF